jgi:hypothetical protein
LKRLYFLAAVAIAELLVGSVMFYGAAAPDRTFVDVTIVSGADYHKEFDILGTGRLNGNLSELQGRTFDLFVFDAPGFASYRDGSGVVPPLFTQNGTSFVFGVNLTGSGPFHVVVVDFPARGALNVHVDLVVLGLKTGGTILAAVVIVGGLALVGASLMMSVWGWRHSPPVPKASSNPTSGTTDPPGDDPQSASADPPDDDTKIY